MSKITFVKKTFTICAAAVWAALFGLTAFNAGSIADNDDGLVYAAETRNGGDKPAQKKSFDPPSVSNPAIAIVIDDIGGEYRRTPKFLEIDGEITYAVMPGYGFTEKARELIKQRGREMMIHMPMQKRGGRRYRDTTVALWKGMTPDEVRGSVDRMIAALPEAVGGNNHMGSSFTRWEPGMRVVMEELKKNNLFFVDSVTGGHTFSYNLALEMGLKAFARDVFLDYHNNDSYVERELMSVIATAKKRGSGLAICHPRSATLRTLSRIVPKIGDYGVRLVPASVIVHTKAEQK